MIVTTGVVVPADGVAARESTIDVIAGACEFEFTLTASPATTTTPLLTTVTWDIVDGEGECYHNGTGSPPFEGTISGSLSHIPGSAPPTTTCFGGVVRGTVTVDAGFGLRSTDAVGTLALRALSFAGITDDRTFAGGGTFASADPAATSCLESGWTAMDFLGVYVFGDPA